jgi:glycosyltransferase involved in cell wall biosynthesis
MKTISVVMPTYNEHDNIIDSYNRVKNIFDKQLSDYNYEILFIDNCSTDGTRDLLKILASKDPCVKVILNGRNFGWSRSSFYGIINTTGDCTVLLSADMQEPPEKMVDFVREWEEGYKVVIGIKSKSKENKLIYFLRNCYYNFINSIAEIDQIKQFMGFGLYDRSFVDVLRDLDDPMPYFRGIVSELGFNMKKIEYVQEKRKKGKTHFNFFNIYDLAMLGITSYSKVVMRIATLVGFMLSFLSIAVAIVTLLLKAFHVIEYPLGIAGISIGVFALGGINLFFVGLLGEYILNINARTMRRPLVVEEERINFDVVKKQQPIATCVNNP